MTSSADEMSTRAKLRRALTAAMKERDAATVSVLRTSISAIDNAEAVAMPERPRSRSGPIPGAVTGHGARDVARREWSEGEITTVLVGERADRVALAAQYQDLGRHEDAARLRHEAAILGSLLPDG
jgi:uncharacterized protein YqeY